MSKEPHDPFKIAFIFKNMQCTEPTNKPLAEWCVWAFHYDKKILKFLHKAGQEYVNHGGCGVYTFDRWTKQLERNCTKFLKDR